MRMTARPAGTLLALLCAVTSTLLGQAPRFSAEMTPADFQTLFSRDVFDDTYLPAPFTSGDTLWPEALIRFKGHSTRYYAKKSYRVRFSTANLFRGWRQVNFNSMYTDKSFLREKLAWDLFADLGTLAPTAELAVFSLNGEEKGVFALIPKVDRYLLQVNGRTVAPMYEANDFWNSADLTVQPDSILKMHYDKEIGSAADYSDLAALIAALNGAPDGSFADTVRKYVDTASVLRWFAVNTLTMMGDSYNKNYLLYNDTSKPAGRWTVIPWDYDLSWGRTGDLAVPYPASLLNDGFAYTFSPLAGPSNVLKDRWMATPELREGFRTYLGNVVDSIFTEERFWPRIDSLAALVRADAEADPQRWGTMEDFDEHVEALKYYVTARRNFLRRTFLEPPSGTYDTETLPFAGEGTPHHFVGFDGRLLATLRFTGVSGLDSITVVAHPAAAPPGLPAHAAGRAVNRWIEVIPHPSTADFTAALRWGYQDVSSTDREVDPGVGDERLLRAHVSDGAAWGTIPGRVNSFANTVTIDSIPAALTGPGRAFALFLSETYAPTWTAVANNYWERWHDVRFTDSLHGFIVGEHGSFLRTTDGGDSWERDSIGSALHFFSAAPGSPPDRIFAAGDEGSLRESADTGRSWTAADPGVGTAFRSVSFDGTTGVVAGDSGRAFQTRDGGSSWHPVATGLTENFEKVALLPLRFVAAGDSVRIFTETLVPTPPGVEYALSKSWATPARARALAILGTTVWVAGDSGFAAFAEIDDDSLTVRSIPGAGRLRAIALLDDSRIYVAGDGGAVHYSADAGLTWYRQLTASTNDLRAVALAGSVRAFAVGNGGTILRTDVPGTLTDIPVPAPGVPTAFRLLQNYPNPFNPSTAIAFDLPVSANVTVEVFDVLGRAMGGSADGSAGGSKAAGWLSAGRHEFRWTASGAATGVYFYRLRALDGAGRVVFTDVKKMMLAR